MKQESKRVNVPDLRDLIEFWEMKDDIMNTLGIARRLAILTDSGEFSRDVKELIFKIESIGKKEGE